MAGSVMGKLKSAQRIAGGGTLREAKRRRE